MNNYYKFRISHFKLNEELKTIEQVNDAVDSKSVSNINNPVTFDSMLTVINRDSWEPLTEEAYSAKRAEVLAILSAM
jgi:hypothetical protein